MRYISSFYTDKGKRKGENQDSLLISQAEYQGRDIMFAAVCDGMGGLQNGEIASAAVIVRLSKWFQSCFERLTEQEDFEDALYDSWELLLQDIHKKLRKYGQDHGLRMGTTLTAMMLWGKDYYIAHVGDSRIYEIKERVIQLTCDQILAQLDNADKKVGKHILTQGIGCSAAIRPAYYSGKAKEDALYLLCTDGFRNQVGIVELQEAFWADKLYCEERLTEQLQSIAKLVLERGERDNMSAILIRTQTGREALDIKSCCVKNFLIKKEIVLAQSRKLV